MITDEEKMSALKQAEADAQMLKEQAEVQLKAFQTLSKSASMLARHFGIDEPPEAEQFSRRYVGLCAVDSATKAADSAQGMRASLLAQMEIINELCAEISATLTKGEEKGSAAADDTFQSLPDEEPDYHTPEAPGSPSQSPKP